MTQTKLILEKGVFSEDEREDTPKIIRRYFPYLKIMDFNQVLKFRPYLDEPDFERCAFRGSMGLAAKMKVKFDFCNCLNWMPRFRPYLLNNNYRFDDFKNVIERFKPYQEKEFEFFLRPCSGLKEFSGQAFTNIDKLKSEFQFATVNRNIDPYIICVVAPLQKVREEYRCIFIDNTYIDGCQYLQDGELVKEFKSVPIEAINLAKEIAGHDYFVNNFQFVIDVCKNEKGEYKLLEINGFNTSSFYFCNLDAIYGTWAKSLE